MRGGARGAAGLLAVLALVPQPAHAGGATPPDGAVVRSDPGCGVLPVVESDGVLTYRLPHAFLTAVPDSVRARRGTLRARRDYFLDPLRGELRLVIPPAAGETLWVEACWLVDAPALEYQRQTYTAARAQPESAAAPAAAPPGRPATAHDPQNAPGGAALTVTGNKTIAVDFGSSQDAFLRQSLDLAVSGSLAPGVQLTGVLSDRNTPLTAAGSTQDLQSVDQVLLELKAPSGDAAFGDVGLDVQQGEFGRVQRRLQGVRADWSARGFTGSVAAASAPGEFNRLSFFGVDGQQGPYTLTDRSGGTGITVVAGSEVVTVDGAKMTRGEAADYSIEYDRAQITFSNRRPITSTSRITVDYQYTVNRYRRSFAAAGGRWDQGPLQIYTQILAESDDKSRPLAVTLDASDMATLALAGDSTSRAVGAGVTAGGGDYDTVRVAGKVIYAFAGPDSGKFSVQFTQVGAGQGDYADSIVIAGRNAYHYVGQGVGDWRIGRALPLPESHELWTVGGRLRQGPLAIEAEGAVSKHDLNTASSLDDQNNTGTAERLALSLEGAAPAGLGRAGVTVLARNVDRRFAAFGPLERPFAQEDWGLPIGGDLERQRRLEADGFVRPRTGTELRWTVASLETPGGFRGVRRTVNLTRDGLLFTRAAYERADGTQSGARFDRGGREHARGELRWNGGWLVPGLSLDSDVRRTPSDSTQLGTRVRQGDLSLSSGRRLAWKASVGAGLRRDAQASGGQFLDQTEGRSLRLGLESPAQGPLGAAFSWQRRDTRPISVGTTTRSDLASLRLALENPKRGLSGNANLEITSEGQTQRARTLVFVGGGRGAYDALGNFVGKGDYDLGITLLPGLEKVARAALSSRAAWSFGASEAWKGSRVEFAFESDARRRGDLLGSDVVIPPGRVLGDPGISLGSVDQRLEADLAPGARMANFRLRLERRVSADRSYDNFAQTQDDRTGDLKWRVRANAAWSAELDGQVRRQQASQTLLAGTEYGRTLIAQGGTGQLIFQPGTGLRVASVIEATWSRPEGQILSTRTVRIGPDLSTALGPRGRGDFSLRRSFIAGPASVALLPTAEPVGAPRWEGSAHADLRVRESTTFGVSYSFTDRPGTPVTSTGRVELRAFF